MEKHYNLFAILLPLLAVAIGFLVALIIRPKISTNLKLLLAFSGAFLLATLIFELLPAVYSMDSPHTGVYIVAGLMFQIVLEFGSKGAEHGHIHIENKNQFPSLLFLSICLHALTEGFPLAENASILIGILIHKIPVAIIISLFLLASSMNTAKVTLFLLVFALMTPLGSAVVQYFDFTVATKTALNAFVVGLLLHVATTILFESSKNHQFNFSKLCIIILGFGIAYFL